MLLGIFLLVFLSATKLSAERVYEDSHQREVLDIAVKLRCAVCQSQSVGESDSELAVEMKAIIGEQLNAGQTEDEIIDYFVQRYGDYILMKPRTDGAGRALWLTPLLAFLILLGVVGWQIRLRAKPAGQTGQTDQADASLDDQQRARLQQLRNKK